MPSIPITDVVPRIQYTATSGQTQFAVPFVFFAQQDLSVYLTPVDTFADDYYDILTLTTEYTVSSNINYTGQVTLNVAAASGDIITIVRSMANQRLNYYIQDGAFTANAVNTDFESEVLMIQQDSMYTQTITPHYNLSASPQLADADGGQDVILPVLAAGECWVKDSTNNFIMATPFAQSASGSMVHEVTQVAHGLFVGQIVRFNGTSYVLAKADTGSDAEVIGIVEQVVSANVFVVLVGGYVDVLAGLTPGGTYFLSDSVNGTLTLTEPTTVGSISKPLLIADSATSGYFFNMRGKIIPTPPSPPPAFLDWYTATINTSMAVNSGYVIDAVGLQMLLPATCNVGDTIKILGLNSWTITQNAGQTIRVGNTVSTLGVGGSVSSTQTGDCVTVTCCIANTGWIVEGGVTENFTIV